MLLTNVCVLDLSQYIPGPYLTRNLADLGAQVIKVEPPGGDPMRLMGQANDEQISPVYNHLNQGKKIVRLDLKSQAGMNKFKQLLSNADILIEGFRPGVLDKLTLGHQALKEINPTLILCSLTGYGQTGPYAHKAGHDLGYCAAAGLLNSKTNINNDSPQFFYPPLADHVGAMQACNSILAALYWRTHSGEGVFIDASLYEPVLAWQYLVQSDQIAQVLGGEAAYYNVYETLDGKFVSLAALEEKFWLNFCHAINKHDWVDGHRNTLPQKTLINALGILFKSKNRNEWMALLDGVDCCFEPVPDLDEVAIHPQTSFRNMLNQYPNMIDGKRLTTNRQINEASDIDSVNWD